MEPGSGRYELNATDMKKLAKSFALSAVGVLVVYLGGWLEMLPTAVEWGAWGPLVGGAAPFLANFVRKFFANYTGQAPKIPYAASRN